MPMPTPRVIQLIGCALSGHQLQLPHSSTKPHVDWVPDVEAEFWGIYLQDPATDTFYIVADFYQKSAALEYVATQAASYGYEIDDKTILLNGG